jgi:HicB_like antitoxin of bacterial toxin-antitoxin system
VHYAVLIEKGERNYSACVPDLPGCASVGDMLEEAKAENPRGDRISSRKDAPGWDRRSRSRRVGLSMSRAGMTHTQFSIRSATPLDAVAADLSRSTKRGRPRRPPRCWRCAAKTILAASTVPGIDSMAVVHKTA